MGGLAGEPPPKAPLPEHRACPLARLGHLETDSSEEEPCDNYAASCLQGSGQGLWPPPGEEEQVPDVSRGLKAFLGEA